MIYHGKTHVSFRRETLLCVAFVTYGSFSSYKVLLISSLLLSSATSFGHGTYFAVNASYSALPTYSRPAANGSQLMFVVRVLTGVYTVGHSDMRVPPPRSDLGPHDRYDSVVDRMNHPNMYVVFHDNQAYPDYLITFK